MRSFNSEKIHQITNYYAIDCWLKIELKRRMGVGGGGGDVGRIKVLENNNRNRTSQR